MYFKMTHVQCNCQDKHVKGRAQGFEVKSKEMDFTSDFQDPVSKILLVC